MHRLRILGLFCCAALFAPAADAWMAQSWSADGQNPQGFYDFPSGLRMADSVRDVAESDLISLLGTGLILIAMLRRPRSRTAPTAIRRSRPSERHDMPR